MSASDSVDYVDEELYAEIKDICKSIDWTVSFAPGDITKYALYKEKFKKFVDGETTVWIRETGEEAPELCVTDKARYICFSV